MYKNVEKAYIRMYAIYIYTHTYDICFIPTYIHTCMNIYIQDGGDDHARNGEQFYILA
jgi:hypothetical protein